MSVDAGHMRELIDEELARVSAPERRACLSALLVPPSKVRLEWDYGKPGERLDCWLVGQSTDQDVLLFYCV